MLLFGLAAAGEIQLDQTRFTVQEKSTFRWVYTVGEEGFGLGDELILEDPVFHGMRWSKWGEVTPYPELCTPGSTGQTASYGYLSAQVLRDGEALDGVEVSAARSNCDDATRSCDGSIHTRAETSVYLETDVDLLAGDELHLVVGDIDGCETVCEEAGEPDCSHCAHCGFEMPDRSFFEIPLTAEECLDGACTDLDSQLIRVESEDTRGGVQITADQEQLVGQAFPLKVALLDPYGNAHEQARDTLEVLAEGLEGSAPPAMHTLSEADGGWYDFELTLDQPGVYRVQVDVGGTVYASHPIEVFEAWPTYRTWWGDVHTHHGFTHVDEDGFARDVNHDYARDVVGLDVVAESVKAAGLEIDEDALWEELVDNCSAYTVDESYLVLLAFEWIGNVAAAEYGTETNGHHNVYYDSCDGPYGTHDTDVIDSVDAKHGLWTWLDEVQAKSGVRAVTVPHAMRFTGSYFETDRPDLQKLAEIYSEWGDNSIVSGNPKGSVQEMFQRGVRTGFIAATDNHDGWLGNPYALGNGPGGLGAWLAPSLTRADVFDAMKARRTYATTGHRPILRFDVVDGSAEAMQGTEIVAQAPEVRFSYHGTDTITSVRAMGMSIGSEGALSEVAAWTPSSADAEGTAALSWDRSDYVVWLEVEQQDGQKAWSSPVFLTADCERMNQGAVDPNGVCGPVDTDEPDSSTPDTGSPDSGQHDTPLADTGGPGRRSCGGCAGAAPVAAWWWLPMLALVRRR